MKKHYIEVFFRVFKIYDETIRTNLTSTTQISHGAWDPDIEVFFRVFKIFSSQNPYYCKISDFRSCLTGEMNSLVGFVK